MLRGMFYVTLCLSTACASAPATEPSSLAENFAKPEEGKAVLVTYRKTIKPEQFAVENFIEDKSLGELRNQEFSWTYIEPGEYTLKTRWQEGALIPSTERPLTIEADKYYLVEMRGGVGVAVLFKSHEFKPTSTSLKTGDYLQAVKWLDNCCRLIEQK